MEKTDVLVVGGSASGVVAATTGKSFHPDKDVLLIRKEEQVLVPCGIPYVFGSLETSDQNLIPDAALANAGVRLMVGEVVSIDQENKVCKTADGTEIAFDKLILALGSTPMVPKWLKGSDKENVFVVPKDKVYLDGAIRKLEDCQKVIIIGGGFIGVEVADELNKTGKDVTIVEILPHILEAAFDEELAIKAEEMVKSRGVKVRSGDGVKEISGNKEASEVILNNGEELEADAVILAMGYHPNTALAEKSGLELNKMGFIKVNEYMMTDTSSIFAVGDCAEKKSFITRTPRNVMLASTSCTEARIAALNLYKLSTVRAFGGTIAIYSTVIGDTAFGVAGVTESLAKDRGFNIITGVFEGIDKHPGALPDTHQQIVKLIAIRESGVIIGGQVMGGASTGELTNLIGFAIQNGMTVDSILTAQIGTHPLLTAPPTAYPLMKAAEAIRKKCWVN
ncbi:MAG: FAD-dependent oxidoreductase [Chloroflexi bacterium]|jgi:NADH oxidase (H2O2-forming)|nr:FAD-dependent oxidoreductase [Chloroflexota bacterium]